MENDSNNTSQLNLFEKLAKIRALSDVAQKDRSGYNYKYTDITSILAKVTAGMKKYGVSLIPSITPGTASVGQNVVTNTKINKAGDVYDNTVTEMLFQAEMVFRWVNDEDPEQYIEIPWFVTGSMSDCAQAMGAGLTYTMRQFLTAYFQIAQPDSDPDAYRSKQREAEAQEEREIASGIIEEFDKAVRKFLADNSDKSEDVKNFISRYAKRGNYLAIKEPKLAAKLLADFEHTYLGKE